MEIGAGGDHVAAPQPPKTALERLHYYQRLLGLPLDQNAPDTITLDRRELTEENFDEAYAALIGQYDKSLTMQIIPALKIAGDTSPAQQSGASGQGRLYLNLNEDAELNRHGQAAQDMRLGASILETILGQLALIPDMGMDLHFWGLGGHMIVFGGSLIARSGRFHSSVMNTLAANKERQGVNASKTTGYQRCADDWLLQYNLAVH